MTKDDLEDPSDNENLGDQYASDIANLMVDLMWVIVNPGPLGILDLDSA